MDKTLTIIIPTYNMEAYLHRCLDSQLMVEASLLNSLEILVINDGSKDASLSIANDYNKRFPGIVRVIDKENGNYGSCINRGLKEASGKYVKVIDADDYVNTNHYGKLLNLLKGIDTDLIVTDFDCVNEEGGLIRKWTFQYPPNTELTFLNYCDSYGFKNMQMHAVAYRRELLLSMGYRQTEGISFTDQEWMYYPMEKVKTFYYFPISVYQYLMGREGQTIADKNMPRVLSQHLTILYREIEFLNKLECDSRLYGYYRYRTMFLISYFYRYLISINDTTKLEEIEKHIYAINPHFFNEMNSAVLIDKYWPFKFIMAWRKNEKIKLKAMMTGYNVIEKIKGFRN